MSASWTVLPTAAVATLPLDDPSTITALAQARPARWVAWIVTVMIMLMTLLMVCKAHVGIPISDEWNYLSVVDYLDSLLVPHNEHLIPLPKLLLAADMYFGANGAISLGAILLVQLVHASLLSRLARQASPGLLEILPYAMLFWAYPFTNFILGFQWQFVAVFLFASMAFASLAKAKAGWLAAAPLATLFATLTMANGVLAGVILFAGAWMTRASRRLLGWLAASAVFNIFLYLLARLSVSAAANEGGGGIVAALAQPVAVLSYVGVYLGAPIARLLFASGELSDAGLLVAGTTGFVGVFIVCGAFAICWVDGRLRQAGPLPALAAIIAFVLATAGVTALGRVLAFPLTSAATGRYGTPALLFWLCAALFVAGTVRPRLPSMAAVVSLGGLLFTLVMMVSQPFIIRSAIFSPQGVSAAGILPDAVYLLPSRLADRRMAVAALRTRADDPAVSSSVYIQEGGGFLSAGDRLRAAGLAPFNVDWTVPPGQPVRPGATSTPCPATGVRLEPLASGDWRLMGESKNLRDAQGLVFTTVGDHVTGYGVQLADRDWAELVSGGTSRWGGYVSRSVRGPVRLWLIINGGNTRCLIGEVTLPGYGTNLEHN